jgi:hypothetical protein
MGRFGRNGRRGTAVMTKEIAPENPPGDLDRKGGMLEAGSGSATVLSSVGHLVVLHHDAILSRYYSIVIV